MPITAATIYPLVKGALVSSSLTGGQSDLLALAISQGLGDYVLSGLTFNSVDSGTAGSGVGTNVPGTVFLSGTIVYANLIASMSASSISGSSAPVLAQAIADSISQSFALAIPTINTFSVGVGTGVCTFVPAGASGFMVNAFNSNSISGTYGAALANAIGVALDTSLLTVVFNTVIVGSPSTAPSAGFSIGGTLI